MTAILSRSGQPKHRKPFPTHIIVFLAPAVVIYGLFMIYPLFDSLRLGFFVQVTRGVEEFVGTQNYVTLLTDEAILQPRLLNALKNSFLFFAVNMLVPESDSASLGGSVVDEDQRRFAIPRADLFAGYPVSSDCRVRLEALVKPALGNCLRHVEGFRLGGLCAALAGS